MWYGTNSIMANVLTTEVKLQLPGQLTEQQLAKRDVCGCFGSAAKHAQHGEDCVWG